MAKVPPSDDSRTYDVNTLKLPGFVTDQIKNETIDCLSELKGIIDELLNIWDNTTLPSTIEERIIVFSRELSSFFREVEYAEQGSSDVVARNKETLANKIKAYYQNCFSVRVSDSKRLLDCYSIARSFMKPDLEIKAEMNVLRLDLIDSGAEAKKIVNELNTSRTAADNIIEELKKKVSEQTVSNYAVVFGKEADKYRTFANHWLRVGIGISVLFIVFMIIISLTKFLPTEVFSENGVFMRYDFTNLVAKILIVAVIVFLMSFAFKQYSVNRHLQTLSQHRQNALNSYKLLTASIIGDDINSRNVLMVQIAKAIYEHSQSTGFLNEKGQNVNSGIVELTKIIGENRPS